MIDRIARAIGFGFVGAIIGFVAVDMIVDGISFIRDGCDPFFGGEIGGLFALPTGLPLGFPLGAIIGFRERKPKRT